MIVAVLCLAGGLLFAWPFLGLGLPPETPALAVCVALCVGLAAVEVSARRLDTRRLALLATLVAVDAALRAVLVIGVAGFSPIFFLVLCSGYVLGPRFGFLVGAASLLVSALVTGGLGPWVPYELVGVGWCGMVAGVAGLSRSGAPSRLDVAVLAGVGLVLGWGYGALLDVYDWTQFRLDPGVGWAPGMSPGTALDHFARYYLTTSLVYDTFRAVGNALLVVGLGAPVLLALRRHRTRFSVERVAPAP